MYNYITLKTHYHSSRETYNWLRSLYNWNSIDKPTYNLFLTMLINISYNLKFGKDILGNIIIKTKIPIYSQWIREKAKAKAWWKLIECGLIEVDKSYQKADKDKGIIGESKKYGVAFHIIQTFEHLTLVGKHKINLFNGRTSKRNKNKMLIIDEKLRQPPKRDKVTKILKSSALVDLAIDKIRAEACKCPLNKKRVLRYYERLNKLCLRGQVKHHNFKNKLIEVRNKAKVFYDRINQNDDEYGYYQPSYNYSISGRINEKGYGLQNVNNEIKREALHGMNYINMDIKASQLNGLCFLLQGLKNGNNIAQNVTETGAQLFALASSNNIPKWLIKKALYGTIFSLNSIRNSEVDKFRTYCKQNNINHKPFFLLLKIIEHACKSLVFYLSKNKTGLNWINHCGIKLSVEALNKRAKEKLKEEKQDINKASLKRKKNRILLSFYLQGLEAYFIHTLVRMSGKDKGYVVISNQHDGCIIANGNSKIIIQNMESINKKLNTNLFKIVEKQIC